MSSESMPTHSHSTGQFISAEQEVNLPSPFPLPGDSSRFSFSPYSSAGGPSSMAVRSSGINTNSDSTSLAQEGPAYLLVNTSASASDTYFSSSSSSVSAPSTAAAAAAVSGLHCPSVVTPPEYTLSSHSSHTYLQQPPLASWATHRMYHTPRHFFPPMSNLHTYHHQDFFTPHSQPLFIPSSPRYNLGQTPSYTYGDMFLQQQNMVQYPANHMRMAQPLQPYFQNYAGNSAVVPTLGSRLPGILPAPSLSEFLPGIPSLLPSFSSAVVTGDGSTGQSPASTPVRLPTTTSCNKIPPRSFVPEVLVTSRATSGSPLINAGCRSLYYPAISVSNLPSASCDTVYFSGLTPHRCVGPAERDIMRVRRSGSMEQTPPPTSQSLSRTAEVAHPPEMEAQQKSCRSRRSRITTVSGAQGTAVSRDQPLPQSAEAVQRKTTPPMFRTLHSTNSGIIRPIPIRIQPPTSTFSWPKALGCPALIATTTSESPISTTSVSPGPLVVGKVRKTTRPSKKGKARIGYSTFSGYQPATANQPAPSVDTSDTPQPTEGHHIIHESELNIGEEVVVETETGKSRGKDEWFDKYKDFVMFFKSHRISLGYSLIDVTQQVSLRYGKRVSLSYMTNFEDLVLSERSHIPLMSILNTWVQDTAKASGSTKKEIRTSTIGVSSVRTSIIPLRFKRKRTVIEAEEEFSKKVKPTVAEMRKMADKWKVEHGYVQNWFRNRRRLEKKQRSFYPSNTPDIGDIRIPSFKYDITLHYSMGWETSRPPHVCYIKL